MIPLTNNKKLKPRQKKASLKIADLLVKFCDQGFSR